MVNPCDQPQMPAAAWRRFLRLHPHWIAPHVAPCTVAGAALGIAIVIAPVPRGVAIAPAQPPAQLQIVPQPWGTPALPAPVPEWPIGPGAYVVPSSEAPVVPGPPVDVPEPPSLLILATGVGLTGIFSAVPFRAGRAQLRRMREIARR